MLVLLISLAILLIVFILQLLYFYGFLKRPVIFKYLFWFVVAVAVLIFIYLTFLQGEIWRQSPLFRFLVPPFKPPLFVIVYNITHLGINYLISLGAAFIFLILAIKANLFFHKRFFEDEEPYLGALSIFILSHPFFLYYLTSVLGLGLLSSVFVSLFKKQKVRLSFYHFWLPLAILVIIIRIIYAR